tara:strand:- start:87 stop:260 length:174 start_codon:yes stop_codon:yes gene_type:complete
MCILTSLKPTNQGDDQMTFFGYEIFENDDGTFQVSVGGWIYICETIDEAKQHIREGK